MRILFKLNAEHNWEEILKVLKYLLDLISRNITIKIFVKIFFK